MPLIDDDIVARVKSDTDILGLIGRTVTLKKSGSGWMGLCPFHLEKTPSFNVSPQKGRFKCFGCGEAGSVIDWIIKTKGLDFVEATKLLASDLGIHIDDAPPKKGGLPPKKFANLATVKEKKVDSKVPWLDRKTVRNILHSTLNSNDRRSPFLQWLDKKGIDRKTIGRLMDAGKLGMSVGNQLVFFYPNGVKIRRDLSQSHSSYWAEGFPDQPWLSGGLDHPKIQTVFICEGESDTMRMLPHMGDGEIVICVPSASWVPSPEMCHRIGSWRTVVLCFDGDVAGWKATQKIGELLLKHAQKPCVLDLKVPDDEDICTLDEKELEKLLDSPKPIT